MKDILKRLYTIKKRLYIEAKYLADYGFNIGQAIKYEIDKEKKQISVIPAEAARKHVAKTTQRSGNAVPVIDIKAEEISDFLANHQKVEVEIQQGQIVFTVKEAVISSSNVVDFEAAKNEKLVMQKRQYSISVVEFGQVVNYQQMDIFDLFQAEKQDIKASLSGKIGSGLKEKAIRMLSSADAAVLTRHFWTKDTRSCLPMTGMRSVPCTITMCKPTAIT